MPPDPGGGGASSPGNRFSDLSTGTHAWASGSGSGGKTRSFEQIIAEEKQRRNILEIHIQKINSYDENSEIVRPKSLTFEDLGELLFDELKIDPEECIAINLNTGRYDQREIKFKPGVNITSFFAMSLCFLKNTALQS